MLQVINMKKIFYLVSVVLILLIILANIIDVKWQFNREIDRVSKLSLNEIEEQYGEEIYNVFLLSETGGYDEPTMSYFKSIINRYYFDFSSMLYDNENNVIGSASAGIELESHRIPIIRVEIIDFPHN
ncbi:MAG: hypothetical protein U9N10_03780 [Bacillota bacterium]|nr:hypothetical protein [Bacillota bacterium]